MDAIINDFSLNGQFESPEKFFDSLAENTLPAFQDLLCQKYEVLKSYTTYARKISSNMTLYDTLRTQRFRGYPEATRFKSFLSSCSENPFWSDSPQTDCSAEYYVDQISGEDAILPNCITEALTRNAVVLSFVKSDFKNSEILIYKNGQAHKIQNVYDGETTGRALFCRGQIGLSELLMHGKYDLPIVFAHSNQKYYADEGFVEGSLSIHDGLVILENFRKSIEFICKGQLKSRFTDSITHKQETYYEFRCSLPDKKEFRIYYFWHQENLVYLNSIVKKTPQIPQAVKNRSVELIKNYRTSS